MARVPATVALLSNLTGVEAVTVGVFARHLRNTGFMSEGRAGRGAAHVTPSDAASLVLALLACETPSAGPRAVDVYGGLLRVLAGIPRGTPEVLQTLVKLPLGEFLEAILGEHSACLREQLAGDGLELTLHRPFPRAELFLIDGIGRRLPIAAWQVSADRLMTGGYKLEIAQQFDRRTSIACTELTLLALADLIRPEPAQVAA